MPRSRGKLTDKQAEFVRQYLVDLNATQAAIRAGYTEKYAGRMGAKLVVKSHVQEAIAAAKAARAKRTEITADRVLKEYARLGFASIDSFFTWNEDSVNIIDSADIEADDLAAVSEITATRNYIGEEQTGLTIKLKLHNKKGALDALAQHLGLDAATQRVKMITEKEAEELGEQVDATLGDMFERYQRAAESNGTATHGAE